MGDQMHPINLHQARHGHKGEDFSARLLSRQSQEIVNIWQLVALDVGQEDERQRLLSQDRLQSLGMPGNWMEMEYLGSAKSTRGLSLQRFCGKELALVEELAKR